MTPLVDVMLVLVCFLLPQFDASGEACGCADAIDLPSAVHTDALHIAPIVTIGSETITLDGRLMAYTDELDGPIEALAADAETLKRNWSILHADAPFTAAMILQIDRDVPYEQVRPVLETLRGAGYPNVHLAVMTSPQ